MVAVRFWDSEVAVECPSCKKEALFDGKPYEFNTERDWKKSERFEACYRFNGWRVVERYPSLVRWDPKKAIADTKHRYKHGVFKCFNCGHLSEGQLNWPEDAYFQWNIRGTLLWAINRSHALALLEYIKSGHRNGRRRCGFYKLPSIITSKKNRELVVKRIEQTLR